VKFDRAVGHSSRIVNQPHRRQRRHRLARTALADQSHGFARLHRQIESIDGFDRATLGGELRPQPGYREKVTHAVAFATVVYRFAATERKVFTRHSHTNPVSENDPIERVADHWEAVIDDMEATAEGYREAGVSVLELHPGDVTVLDEGSGLDVLVPDSEFEELETFAAETAFDSYEVYRAEESGVIFALIVLEDAGGERAVCCPTYYEREEIERLKQRLDDGVLYTRIRPLADDRVVTFSYEDPDLF
jgi:hypothetical protein